MPVSQLFLQGRCHSAAECRNVRLGGSWGRPYPGNGRRGAGAGSCRAGPRRAAPALVLETPPPRPRVRQPPSGGGSGLLRRAARPPRAGAARPDRTPVRATAPGAAAPGGGRAVRSGSRPAGRPASRCGHGDAAAGLRGGLRFRRARAERPGVRVGSDFLPARSALCESPAVCNALRPSFFVGRSRQRSRRRMASRYPEIQKRCPGIRAPALERTWKKTWYHNPDKHNPQPAPSDPARGRSCRRMGYHKPDSHNVQPAPNDPADGGSCRRIC